MKNKISLLIVLIMILPAVVYCFDASTPSVGIVEKLGNQLPDSIELYDESGNLRNIGEMINKPTIIALVYYECPGICTPLLNEVADLVDKMDLVIGKDYQILTVSFDFNESSEIAGGKKDNYVNELKKKIDPEGWKFLTGDSLNVVRLTGALGFYYQQTGTDWIHPTGLIVVSPDGMIIRYLNGVNQLPLDVKLALMEALKGHSSPTISKILNICYSYDPESKHYVFNFVRIGGIVTLLLVGVFVAVFILKKGNKGKPKSKKKGGR
jgi:protein SCO1